MYSQFYTYFTLSTTYTHKTLTFALLISSVSCQFLYAYISQYEFGLLTFHHPSYRKDGIKFSTFTFVT